MPPRRVHEHRDASSLPYEIGRPEDTADMAPPAQVRPPTGSPTPATTKEQYCHWDSAHNDYVYTEAWIERLKTKLADPKVFETIVGRAPETIAQETCTCGTCDDAQ